MDVKCFSVCLAYFRFLESDSKKLRPVIIASDVYGSREVLMAVPVSASSEMEPVDIGIANTASNGLLKPSVARAHRLTAILYADLTEEIGRLDKTDEARLKAALKHLLNL